MVETRKLTKGFRLKSFTVYNELKFNTLISVTHSITTVK